MVPSWWADCNRCKRISEKSNKGTGFGYIMNWLGEDLTGGAARRTPESGSRSQNFHLRILQLPDNHWTQKPGFSRDAFDRQQRGCACSSHLSKRLHGRSGCSRRAQSHGKAAGRAWVWVFAATSRWWEGSLASVGRKLCCWGTFVGWAHSLVVYCSGRPSAAFRLQHLQSGQCVLLQLQKEKQRC